MRTTYENGKRKNISLYDVAYDAIRAIPSLPKDSPDKEIEDAISKITEEISAQMDYASSDIASQLAQEIIS